MATPLLIAGGVGLFILGTAWGWVLHMAFIHPQQKRDLPDEGSSTKMEP